MDSKCAECEDRLQSEVDLAVAMLSSTVAKVRRRTNGRERGSADTNDNQQFNADRLKCCLARDLYSRN